MKASSYFPDIPPRRIKPVMAYLSIVKEDSNITRTAVNKLLDWADDASIQIVPLFKKAK